MKLTHCLPQPPRSMANRSATATTRASTARRAKSMCSALALLMCALSGGAMAALPVTTPGSPDPTFGAAGRVLVNPTPGNDNWGGGVLQADGKLVVSGRVPRMANTWSLAAVRVLDNGDLDPSFGSGGIATLPIDHSSGVDSSPALDSTGRILIGGYSKPDQLHGCMVAALRPDGTLDPTFADGGVFRFQLSPDQQSFCQKVVVLADDRIVVIGAESGSPGQTFLLRLTATGALDTAFGAQGVANVPLVAGRFWWSFAAGVDGAMFVSGSDNVYGYVVKLTPGGAVDLSFGTGGMFKTPFTEGHAYTPTVLADGGLLVPGFHGSKHMVMKLAANGVPDAAFGVNGVAEFAHGIGYSAIGAAVQADGRIVVAMNMKFAGKVFRLAAMRLNPDGSVDMTYGVNGFSVVASDVNEVTYGMALAPDGKLWLFGRADLTAADSGLALARLLGTEITTNVVEFYNTGLDHYFITADPNEAAAIDAGAAGPGWTRTGQNWKSGGPNRVCRFYGSPDIVAATGLRRGPNSHFYTIEATECAAVKLDAGWQFESHDFNGWLVPAGGCPAETVAIRRVYNNGFKQNDSNHRYVTSVALYNQMTGLGWTGEGTVFCALR